MFEKITIPLFEKEQSHASSGSDLMDHDMDAIRLNELNRLTQVERERIQEEVHGVKSMAVVETHELLEESFKRFDEHVNQLTSSFNEATWQQHCAAYQYAKSHPLECQYVLTNRNFHIMFLRAELFDTLLAAQRYLRNVALLHKHFGYKALQRPLRLNEDLNRIEQAELKTGKMQIMPSRDRSGRLISVVLLAYRCSIEEAVCE
jgi:hypothetical protein